MRELVYDGFYPYQGYFGRPSICYLRCYGTYGGVPVAIATELDNNPGTSITNRAEHLATRVLGLFRIDYGGDGDAITWIEHYPADPKSSIERFRSDRYALVTFDWNEPELRFVRPQWRHIERADVERLIGGPLGESPRTIPAEPPSRYGRAYSLPN